MIKPATTHKEANKRIRAWHRVADCNPLFGGGDGDCNLHEYLGWTLKQYNHYVETNELPKFKQKMRRR